MQLLENAQWLPGILKRIALLTYGIKARHVHVDLKVVSQTFSRSQEVKEELE